MRYGVYTVFYTDFKGAWRFLKKTDSAKEAETFRKGGYLVKTSLPAYQKLMREHGQL